MKIIIDQINRIDWSRRFALNSQFNRIDQIDQIDQNDQIDPIDQIDQIDNFYYFWKVDQIDHNFPLNKNQFSWLIYGDQPIDQYLENQQNWVLLQCAANLFFIAYLILPVCHGGPLLGQSLFGMP